MRRFRRPPRPEPGPLINERLLRFREVRAIGPDGQQIGVISTRDALQQARDVGLDLVLVSQSANPPVCRIVDYGRHKYETEKRDRENKKKTQDVKGLKIRPRIAAHDLNVILTKARKFLEENHKVRIVCQFRAREITHPEIGRAKLDWFIEQLAELSQVERPPTMETNQMVVVLMPKLSKGPKKDGKTEDKQDSGEAVQDHGVGEDHPTEGV